MASFEKRGNSYRIQSSCGYSAEGKQIYQRFTWKPDADMTAKQIEKELNRQCVLFDEKCKNGMIIKPMKFQLLAEEWFNDYAQLNLRDTTLTRTKQLTKRTYKAIGHIRIDKLNAKTIQKFINSLAMDGANEKNGQPLSKKTMTHYLSFISSIIEYGIKMDMITLNPCKKVTIPRGTVKERNVYTIEETEHFFQLLRSAPMKYRVFFVLLTYTGMRRGEMLGLEWKDFNFQSGIIHIQRTSNYTKSKGIYTDIPKTKESNRFVKIPTNVIDFLKSYKIFQENEKAKFKGEWIDTDRLFVKVNGTPMNPQTPYGWLKQFCEYNSLPFYGIHQFRHLFTSLLVDAGIDIATISSTLGHSCQTTTLNVYSHIFKEHQAKACDAVANALSFVNP